MATKTLEPIEEKNKGGRPYDENSKRAIFPEFSAAIRDAMRAFGFNHHDLALMIDKHDETARLIWNGRHSTKLVVREVIYKELGLDRTLMEKLHAKEKHEWTLKKLEQE